MQNESVSIYIESAVEFLKGLKGNQIHNFSLLYGMFYCNKYINIKGLNEQISTIQVTEIKKESMRVLSQDIFSELDGLDPSVIKIIDWLKKNPPVETTQDILGTVYLMCSEEKKRKQLGEHYTRVDLVELIFNEMNLSLDKGLSLIDPACGSGNFLTVYLKMLLEEPFVKSEVVFQKIYSGELITGVDIQGTPVLISKVRILMIVARHFQKVDPTKSFSIYKLDSLLSKSPILNDNQYDIVATNPPYLRYHSLTDSTRINLKKVYSCAEDKFDLYTLFIEKAIKLAKKNGEICVLCSDKFMTSSYGRFIREYVMSQTNMVQVIDLAKIFPFKAAVLSAVYFLQKEEIKKNKYPVWKSIELDEGKQFIKRKGFIELNDSWRFVDTKSERVFEKIKQGERVCQLNDIVANILVGIQTTADSVFCEKMTEEFIKENAIEEELCFPLIRGQNIVRWGKRWTGNKVETDTYVLYPYVENNDSTIRIDLDDFPNAASYLINNKEILENRSYIQKRKTKVWYDIWVERSHEFFSKTKILTPDLASECRFYLDETGSFFNGTVYQIELKEEYNLEDYKFLLGILNSDLMFFCHRKINPVHLNSKKYRFQSPIMKQYPIMMLNKNERLYKEVVFMVEKIGEKVLLGTDVSKEEKVINKLIYKIYGLEESDILIIEEFLNKV
ncbi:Eco57I restriction-modification methylase domain-containing protein [Bacillus cereus]|uniref:Eco57I restriction-modification methylase domain-containing protein n=1 Tax=Bacillus cereus TaxID=1396 RepID=UPI00124EA2DA|nr:N-6 DNA methylase [Bacillus cereus]KAB2481417.1 N-6 DNA methylase [Bacillus cereus]